MNPVKQCLRMWVVLLLVCLLVFSSGCTQIPADPTKSTPPTTNPPTVSLPTETTTEPTKSDADASLVSLRQALIDTPQLFAVAYFGYHSNVETGLPVDPFAVMRSQAPQLCEDLPFLLNIPQERIIGESGDLLCIVPLDENATVAVSRGAWDDVTETYIYEESVYFAQCGEPILLFFENSVWIPDTQLYISGPSGEVIWYPQRNDNQCVMPLLDENWENVLFDYSPYREILIAEHRAMLDDPQWEYTLPTQELLANTTWFWRGYTTEGLLTHCSVSFDEDLLSVRWNDGISTLDQEYLYAPWELTYEEDYAVLTIDFGEFAGVRRYHLLYSQLYENLYIAMDVLQEEMPIDWEPLYRFLTQPVAPDPVEMAGLWELAWTEVEGDINEADPGKCTIEIITDYNSHYRITYTDADFPDDSFTGKELLVSSEALYYGCSNDEWTAVVDHIGNFGTEYRLTLLYDGTLLLQYRWEMEGIPMVSYGWFRKQ